MLSISYRGRCVVPLLSSELANGGVGRARARSWSGCPILENLTVSFSQIHRTDEATREISETVAADYNAETFARAARRRKLAGLVRWLRAETRGALPRLTPHPNRSARFP